ncbi:MAG: c-type cytochrome [Candidatus Krumholzibacteria bacterium]|nr:c-type cytochrome [Candidatus Krumholzibacteria bacterium]
MEFFSQYVIPPTRGQLELLRYLLVLTYAIHLPFVGMVIGATLLSLAFNARDRDIANPTFARMSKDLMDMVLPNRVVVLVFGVLPLPALWMIYGQWLSKSTVSMFTLLPIGALVVALSFVPLMAYRSSLDPAGRNSQVNFGLGGIGLATLLLGMYILIGAVVRFQDPERWHLAHDGFRWLLSFNVIWKFGHLLLSGLAITGCGILFFFFNWSGREPIRDAKYAQFMKNFGASVLLATVILIPVIGFFYLITTPTIALSGAVYVLAAATLVILFLVFLLAYGAILSPRPRFGARAFILVLAVFLLTGVGDQLTLVNATQEHSAALLTEADEIKAQIELEREAHRAASQVVDVARGEEVFKTVCMTCHRMDERLVGPPLKTVLPKYAGNVDGLISFIQKPEKVNPEYPPMPAPGLPLADIKSVAAYLLGEVDDAGTSTESPQH